MSASAREILAAEWEKAHGARRWGVYPSEHVVRFVARRFRDRIDLDGLRSPRALDLGCGAGANSWFLINEGFSVDAADGSAAALRSAQEVCRWMLASDVPAFPLRFVRCDVAQGLPFADGTFDLVLDACCLQHVEDLDAALAEAHRVLKPGGLLFSIAADETYTVPSPVPFMRKINHGQVLDAYARFAPLTVGLSVLIDEFYPDEGSPMAPHWLVSGRRPE